MAVHVCVYSIVFMTIADQSVHIMTLVLSMCEFEVVAGTLHSICTIMCVTHNYNCVL